MVTRIATIVARNIVGWVIIAIGLVLSLPFVFGPGFVTVLAGLAIADWPGKSRFFRWLRSFHWFDRIDNWVHARFGWRLPEHRARSGDVS